MFVDPPPVLDEYLESLAELRCGVHFVVLFLEETTGQSFIRGDTQIILYGYGLVKTCADASEFHRAYSTHKLVAVIFVRAHWNSPQLQELPLTVEITPTDHYSKATRRTRDIHDLKCNSSEKSYCPMLVKQIKSITFFLCGGHRHKYENKCKRRAVM